MSVYPFPRYADHLLRVKSDTTDDPDWATLNIDPNTLILTFGGVATDGVYRTAFITLDPDLGNPNFITTTRAGGVPATNADLATQHAADITTEIGDTLAPYLYSAVAVGDTVQARVRPNAPAFTTTLVSPGAATLTATPDDSWPIGGISSNLHGHQIGQPDALAFAFVAVDSSDEPIDDDNGCTFTVEVVRLVERRRHYDPPNRVRTPGATSSVAVTGHSIADELRVPFCGGAFGVRLTSITNAPTGLDAIEVHWREVTT